MSMNEICIIEDDLEVEQEYETPRWKILVVDDDKFVHEITSKMLDNFELDRKKINILKAYSAKEAKEIVNEHQDIAVILLDVVMEEEDSGLKFVKYLREHLKNDMTRIILRTGQPGQAPEREVVLNYHINDYKLKTDLTVDKFFVSMVTALRSYQDLVAINLNKIGLEKIIESTPKLYRNNSLETFITGILMQLTSVLHLDRDALYCRTSGFGVSRYKNDFVIKAGIGEYRDKVNRKVEEALPYDIQSLIRQALKTKSNIFTENGFVIYFESMFGTENIIYIKTNSDLEEWDINLIKISCSNISIAFDNLYLEKEADDSQKEIIYTIGEIAEFRSKETGYHIKRVAEYSRLLALKYGFSEEESESIKIASTMHDVGKLGVPDYILTKPGKLTPEEFEIIKTHCVIGYEMLKKSKIPIMKMSADIAYQHHEKFDGSGYPCGLKGPKINIYARIVAIADVFDALISKRVYKNSWSEEEILDYFNEARGTSFDPLFLDLFLESFDEFVEIFKRSPDR